MEEEVYEPMTIYHGYPHKEISVLVLIYITSLLQDGAEGNLVSSGTTGTGSGTLTAPLAANLCPLNHC